MKKMIIIAIAMGAVLLPMAAQAQTAPAAAGSTAVVAPAPPNYGDPAVVQANFEGMASAMSRISEKADQKVSVGHTGFYTGEAWGKAAQDLADRQALTDVGGDTESPLYIGYIQSRSTAAVRKAAGNQFVQALMKSAVVANDAADKLAALEKEIASLVGTNQRMQNEIANLKDELRNVAHAAAAAADKDADWNKVRKPAIDWLARY